MSQYDFGTIDPYVVVGVQLADMLNSWRDALYTLQRGPTRPAWIVPGQIWVNDSGGTTLWLVNMYLGPTLGDVTIFRVDSTTGDIVFNSAGLDLITAGAMLTTNNLSDVASVPAARVNLGLGNLATLDQVNGGLINLAGQMQGALMWLDAGVWKPIAPGSSGQLLKSNGSGAVPTWVANPAPQIKIVPFTASGSFVPTITGPHKITVVGGGAGGYGSDSGGTGGPGGPSGGVAIGTQSLTAGNTYSVVIGGGGGGGPGGNPSATPGTGGGTSSFNGITASGGTPGVSGLPGGPGSGASGNVVNSAGHYQLGGVGGPGPWGVGPGAGGNTGGGGGPGGPGAAGIVIIESLG